MNVVNRLLWLLLVVFVGQYVTGCGSSSNSDSATQTTEQTSLFVDIPKTDPNATQTANAGTPDRKITPQVENNPCPVTQAGIPTVFSDTINVYSGARDLNVLFACNPFIENLITAPGTELPGNKLGWWIGNQYIEAGLMNEGRLIKGVHIQNMPPGSDGETDVRVEYDDSVAGQQKRLVFVDAAEIDVKMRLEIIRYIASGEYYVNAFIESQDTDASGVAYTTTLQLVAYVEAQESSDGFSQVDSAIAKAKCVSTSDSYPCHPETLNEEMIVFNFGEQHLDFDNDLYNKLVNAGENYTDSVYKTGDAGFEGYFDIPSQP
jgi:hypothetical protein